MEWIRDLVLYAVNGLLALVLGLLFRSYDGLKQDVEDLKKESVKSPEWRRALDETRDERKELHQENTRRLDSIDKTLLQVVELAVNMRVMQQEVAGLRDAKHDHGDMIQSHEARLHFLEKK